MPASRKIVGTSRTFMNCISGFIVLLYYKAKLGLRFKMKITHTASYDCVYFIPVYSNKTFNGQSKSMY
jgi:hypothetical protein